MTKKYFGTDGIRGKVGEGMMSPDKVLKLGYAVGRVLAADPDELSVRLPARETGAVDPAVAAAWRRACRSPRFARVMILSATLRLSGLYAPSLISLRSRSTSRASRRGAVSPARTSHSRAPSG